MRLCPRCHTQHPDHVLVCHSGVCGDLGTPLVVRQHTVTQPVVQPAPPPPPGALPPALTDEFDDDDESAEALAKGSSPTVGLRAPGKQPSGQSQRPRDARAEDLVGRILGSYKLLEVIGRGGMGRVYRAEHVKLGRQVALKLLKPEYAVKRDAVARFFQEAKAVNKIRHRNIVDVTDFVELDDGTTFIIMELLEGQSLGRALRTGGGMSQARLLAILVQVCDALEAAHGVGIVHRDLKPDNIYLVHDDHGELAKLLDFGVAKLLTHGDADSDEPIGWQTAAGSVVGTPAYMSPEQAGGLEIDGRSDVYALGAIMYELFCGRPLFTGKSFGEFVLKHMNEPPQPPHQTPGGADISPELEAVILRCLEKKPERRFASVAELRDALIALLGRMDTGLVELRQSGLRRSSGLRGASSVKSPSSGLRQPASGSIPPPIVADSPRTQSLVTDAPPIRETLPTVPPETLALPETNLATSVRQEVAAGAPRRRAPVWIAAVLGVGALAAGGFYVATRGGEPERPAPRATAPTVTPLGRDPAPPRARVTLSLRSDPVGARVFPFGSGDMLCATPCEISIDPDDGGSNLKRTYVLRKDGFQTFTLDVPLDGSAPAEQMVVLQPDTPAVAGQSAATPHTTPHATPHDRDRDRTHADKPPVVADTPPPPPTDPGPQKQKKDKIDRTDTLDPFGNHK